MKARCVPLMIFCGILLIFSGCADKKSRLLSEKIPLNVYDLEEIRAGVDAHKDFLKTYKLIENEKISAYMNDIGQRLASVSERPYLPWRFYLVDNDSSCDAFALPGGNIYISSGLFRFIESEAELAAVIAHEVGHTSAYRYHNRGDSKGMRFGKLAKIGAGAAGGLIGGPAGGAAGSILSGIDMGSPYLKQQFSKDAEAEADGRAMHYLKRLGYPPAAIVSYNKRLASTPIATLPVFIQFFNAHPPSDFRVHKAIENLQKISNNKEPEITMYTNDRHHEMVEELVRIQGGSEKKSFIEKILSTPEERQDSNAAVIVKPSV